MKRFSILLMAVLSMVVVGSMAFAQVQIGVVLPTKDEPRWIQDQNRFEAAFKTAGIPTQILFSQGDTAKEKANVESLISCGAKVIVICPQDGAGAAAAADEAQGRGVKVISYDRLILGTASVDYYVTFDSFAVGAAWGKFLASKATGKENNLYLYAGAASDNNAFIFFAGAWSILQPKIADGTFVIKNSAEAVALKGKVKLTRDEEGQDHRPGHHQLELRRRQEQGRSQPDLRQEGRQGHRLHRGPQRRHGPRHRRRLPRRQGRQEVLHHRPGREKSPPSSTSSTASSP